MNEPYLDDTLFDQDVRGFLFFPETTFEGTTKYKLIFEYNPQILVKLREGDIIATESFSTFAEKAGGGDIGCIYTLLEVTKINPTHITVDRLRRFKFMGAAREFLKEATKDFEEDPRIIRDHVYVEAEAVPTTYAMRTAVDAQPEFFMEPTKPVLGKDTGLLKPPVVERLINNGVEDGMSVGTLHAIYEEKRGIEVKIRPHKMVTHHYSVFGFTGSGKSNLNSVLISKLLDIQKLKVVVFDLSDEYTDLLIDKIAGFGFVVLDANDVAESVLAYLDGRGSLDIAAADLAKHSKKPGVFDNDEFVPTYASMFKRLLSEKRVKILNPQLQAAETHIVTMQDFLDEVARGLEEKDELKFSNILRQIPAVARDMDIPVEENYDHWLLKDIEGSKGETWEDFLRKVAEKAVHKLSTLFLTYDAIIAGIKNPRGKLELPSYFVGLDWIIDEFVAAKGEANRSYGKLCIVVSTNKSSLISLMTSTIESALRVRRKRTHSHDVLFVIDEGHEFVMGKDAKGEERVCSETVERLTRMGRKYGLGVCIASQRVAYLNTTALSNCHTTFVGTMPRKYDRGAICNAYGLSEDYINQVVAFPPGHWYIASNGATGMNNIPIRIVAENREKQLADFFDKNDMLSPNGKQMLAKSRYLAVE